MKRLDLRIKEQSVACVFHPTMNFNILITLKPFVKTADSFEHTSQICCVG